jgi:hypothetical protein
LYWKIKREREKLKVDRESKEEVNHEKNPSMKKKSVKEEWKMRMTRKILNRKHQLTT